jgi:hypothetical protein
MLIMVARILAYPLRSKRATTTSVWLLRLLFLMGFGVPWVGCARLVPLKPQAIPVGYPYQSERLNDGQPQIQRGTRRPIIDGVGWVVGIPSKLLLWDRRVDNHHISDETETQLAAYLSTNDLSNVQVRINQYHPWDDWRRLFRNDNVGLGWRCTVGAISVLGETVLPGRIIGGDHFNPYTNTIHLYSDVPAVALHEGGHAKDFARRRWPGTYGVLYLLPVVPLHHERVATNDVLAYLEENGSSQDQAAARRILYPAYATYVGGAAGQFFVPWSTPLYYSSVIAGHAIGRYSANQLLEESGPVPSPALIGAELQPETMYHPASQNTFSSSKYH